MTLALRFCYSAGLSPKKGGGPKSAALGDFAISAKSGRRRDFACFILVAGTTDALAGTRRFSLVIAGADSDRRWDHVERDSLFVPTIAIAAARRGALAAVTGRTGRPVIARNPLGALFAGSTFGAIRSVIRGRTLSAFRAIITRNALNTIGTIVAGAAFVAVLALRTLAAVGPIVIARTALLHRRAIVVARLHHLVVLIFVAIILAALAALLVEASPAFTQHTVIMVGVLEVIFGLDAVAGELRIARHALVFFQELGGVAALAIVLAIAVRPAGNVARRLSSTSAAAVALLSIDQILILMPQAPASGGP